MGYEFHDRNRDRRGRFDHVHRTSQIHVYCTYEQWERIRMAANAACEDTSSFVRAAALKRADIALKRARIDPKTVKKQYQR